MTLISKEALINDLQTFFPTVEGITPETLLAQVKTDIENAPAVLTADEVKLLRKVLYCANQLHTVIEKEYTENKADLLLRKLRTLEEQMTEG